MKVAAAFLNFSDLRFPSSGLSRTAFILWIHFCSNYLLIFFSARAFGLSIRPFFFKVRSADVETLHLTFWPLMTKVLLETFGLKTLRVCLWENETLWPYILPLPVTSQIAILFLLHSINDCFECIRIVNSKISENFAIKVDVLSFHTSN